MSRRMMLNRGWTRFVIGVMDRVGERYQSISSGLNYPEPEFGDRGWWWRGRFFNLDAWEPGVFWPPVTERR